MSDPELAEGMQNPKIMAALQKAMSDPSSIASAEPEVQAYIQKLMSKMGGAGGMPGMPGGMGGMPGMPGGMGGMPGGMGGMPGMPEAQPPSYGSSGPGDVD